MSNDNGFGVPAGWYPDPLGLPQMRWWDNHGWTEHTTEARAPVIVQETTKLAWADDELPTRRERRGRRERDGVDYDDPSDNRPDEADHSDAATDSGGPREIIPVPTAQTLLQLDPPSRDATPAQEPSPEVFTLASSEPEQEESAAASAPTQDPLSGFAFGGTAFSFGDSADAPGQTQAGPGVDFDDRPFAGTDFGTAFGSTDFSGTDFGAPSAPLYDAPPSTPGFDIPAPAPTGGAAAATETAPAVTTPAVDTDVAPPSPHTPSAWIIALVPLLQLVVSLLSVSALGAGDAAAIVTLAVAGAPYLLVIPLAIADQRGLRRAGYARPASWAWSLLSAPVYLIARAIAIVLKAGNGFGPILVWAGLGLLQVVSVVAVPGLVVSALPEVFSSAAEQSIASDARILGANLTVECPAPPATVIGQQFSCTATKGDGASAADTFSVTVSLQRANGWIDWRVDDWGVYSTATG